MAAVVQGGPFNISLTRSDEGHREYKASRHVRCALTDGVFTVLNAVGLPLPGDFWAFQSEIDPWAFCRPVAVVKKHPDVPERDPCGHYIVEQTWSTRPLRRCGDTPVEDPLLEPARISGDFDKLNEEFTLDRFGDPITNSAFEPIRGPQVEWEVYYPTVHIEQNVADLQLDLLSRMAGSVNDGPLWGFPARCIRFIPGQWRQMYHGPCQIYYTRPLSFYIRAKLNLLTGELYSLWDRDLLDEGAKVLQGHWAPDGTWHLDDINGQAPDPQNPAHFMRATDRAGNPMRVILDGSGLPADVGIGFNTGTGSIPGTPPGSIHVEALPEDDFPLLGIPLTF
jgi:hypothetical protein